MKKYNTDDYIKYRLQKADVTISEVDILINNKLWNTAINRMYYACYYAVGALLLSKGIRTSTHSGCRQKFGQMFINTGTIEKEIGKHYSELFEKRQKGDYDDFIDYDEDTTLRLIGPSKQLIKVIKEYLKDKYL